MSNSGQDRFLNTVRQALGRDTPDRTGGKGVAEASRTPAGLPPRRNHEQKLALVDILLEAARDLKIKAQTCRDLEAAVQAIVSIVKTTVLADQSGYTVAAWNHPLINALNLEPRLQELGCSFFRTELPPGLSPGDAHKRKAELRERMIASGIGLTSADYCLADTATLVMLPSADQARAVSLVPSTHIALVHVDQLLLDLQELYAELKKTSGEDPRGLTQPYMNLISGPSKTADIEMSMVYGVHGPRTLHLLILTEKR